MVRSLSFVFLYTVSFVLCLLFLLSIDAQWIGPFFNSDALYLADVTTDLLAGQPMERWLLTPAPYFFPDGMLYLLLTLLEKNLHEQILFTALFQYAALLAVTALLYHRLGLSSLWAPIGGAILLLASVAGPDQDPFRAVFLLPAGPIFISAHHFSAFLLTLVFYARHPLTTGFTSEKYWPLALLVVLMTASDLLFVLTTVLPYGALHLLQQRQMLWQEITQRRLNWQAHRFPLILVAATLLGLILNRLLMPEVTTSTPFQTSVDRFPDMLLIMRGEFNQWFGHSPLVGLSWFTGVVILITMALRDKRWRLLAILWLIASLLVLITQLTVIDRPQARYMQLLLFLPLLLIPGGVLLIPNKVHLQNSLLALSAVGMLYWGAGLWQRLPVDSEILNYYPDSIVCLDRIAQKKELNSGISNYWLSRTPSMLSRTGLQVLPVTQQFKPNDWIVNKNDFREAAPLQFAVIDKHHPTELDSKRLIELAGKPDQIADCPSITIWIYDKNQLEQALRKRIDPPGLLAPGEQLVFKASALRTGDSGRFIDEVITTTGTTGTLVFGPYQQVQVGNYEARYQLTGENTEGIRWEAILHHNNKTTTLAEGRLSVTNNAPRASMEIKVEDKGRLEIRLFVDTQHKAQIKQLRLTRTD